MTEPLDEPTTRAGRVSIGGRTTEAVLMEQVSLGRHAAFAELYERHAPVAHAVAVGLYPQQASDIVQDVFLRIWQRPGGFDANRGGLQNYVVMKVRGRAIDVLRSNASRRNREHLLDAARLHATGSSEPSVGHSEDEVTVRLLGTLTIGQREAIVLAFYGGYSYEQVSRLLDRPEGTVKGQIRIGLRHLRDQLPERE